MYSNNSLNHGVIVTEKKYWKKKNRYRIVIMKKYFHVMYITIIIITGIL